MPSYAGLPEDKKAALVDFLAQLHGEVRVTAADALSPPRPRGPSRRARSGRCSTASPASTTVMNSVMTAGLHHRWRERAADLARSARASARSTSRPAPATWRSSWRGACARRRGRRLGLLARGCSSARARRRRRPGVRWEWGNALDAALRRRRVRRRDGRLRRAQLLRPRARAGRDGARRAARAGASSCSRSRRRRKPPLSTFFSLWFDRVVPALGRFAGDPEAYTYLPKSVKRFPGPEALGARAGPRRADATSAGSSPRAGSSPCTTGR